MKIIQIILFFHILLFSIFCNGQYSFEYKRIGTNNESLFYTFENSQGNYISLGGSDDQWGINDPSSALIVEIGNQGNVINEVYQTKPDTSFSYLYGFEKENGNYFIVGTLSDSVSYDRNVIYVCELTNSFSLVWEKFHLFPSPYRDCMIIHHLIMPDNTVLIEGKADSSQYSFNDLLFTVLLDQDGCLLDFNFYEHWKEYGVYSDMIFNQDTTAIQFFGSFAYLSIGIIATYFEMDLELNIINSSIKSELPNGDYIFTPFSIAWLPSGNLISSERWNENGYDDKGLKMMLMDEELNIIQTNTIEYGGYCYTPVYDGLGFVDPDYIWVTTFRGAPTNWPGIEKLHLHIFDSNLNLKGVKEYGDTRYWLWNQLVTSDGGCLLTGMIPDCEGCDNHDGYILKVMPEDVITKTPEISEGQQNNISFYPNPFNESITIKFGYSGLDFYMFDFTGQLVLEFNSQFNNCKVNTTDITNGLYFYKIIMDGKNIQSGKLLKK